MNDVVDNLSSKEKSQAILAHLEQKYCAPEWASFRELRSATGSMFERTFDFFAVNTYPSGNFLRLVFEIKVSRGDFANELKNPLKREPAEKSANECWFVTPVGLLDPSELPEGWGLMELTAGGLRKKKHAQQRKIEAPSLPFFVSVARRVSEKPTSQLPAGIWKYQGQEVTLDILRQVAAEAVLDEAQKQKKEAFEKGRQDVQNSFHYQRMKKVFDTVYSVLSHKAEEPEYLESLLNQAKVPYLSGQQKNELNAAINVIKKIMGEA